MIKQLIILSLLVFACFGGIAGNNKNKSFYSDNVSPAVRNSLKFGYDQLSGKEREVVTFSDDFNMPFLRPHWLYKTDAENWTLKERPGYLRLRAKHDGSIGKIQTSNTFSQKITFNTTGEAVSLIDLSNLTDGTEVGFYYLNSDLNFIGISRNKGISRLLVKVNGKIEQGPVIEVSSLMLKVKVEATHVCFEFSVDGYTFNQFGDEFKLNALCENGDFIGLFCFNPLNGSGWADIDWFYYKPHENSDIQFAENKPIEK
ncbi:MAG: hypothetical protein K9H26_04465 [Prolixibacteraceae bacterium]|nr:hypothetical protein [Prolixibacteraceae bacterium]